MLQNLRKTPHGVIATLQTIKMLQAEEGSVTYVRGSCVSGNVRTQGSSNLKTTDAKVTATADRDVWRLVYPDNPEPCCCNIKLQWTDRERYFVK